MAARILDQDKRPLQRGGGWEQGEVDLIFSLKHLRFARASLRGEH